MKTGRDPRHLQRVERVKALYAFSFSGHIDPIIAEIVKKIGDMDVQIGTVATERSVSQIAKIDLAILRQGVFELESGLNPSIAIDEAVEIAKDFGTESSPGFINAVLSSVVKQRESYETTK